MSQIELESQSVWEFSEELESLDFDRAGESLAPAIARKILSFPEEERAAIEVLHAMRDFSVREPSRETAILARAYAAAGDRRPVSLDKENFLVRVKARAALRMAGLGESAWAKEAGTEHPLFSLYQARMIDQEVRALLQAHSGAAHSASFGSFAMFVFLTLNPASEGYFPRDPFANPRKISSQLSLLRNHGHWFSEDELADYSLSIVLRRLEGAENAGKIRIETLHQGAVSVDHSFGYDVDEEFTLELPDRSVRHSLRISAVDGERFTVRSVGPAAQALRASLSGPGGTVHILGGEWSVPKGHKLILEASGGRVCWTLSVQT